jgi:MvaI/BcnI restriction endonuclease family
VTGVLGDEDRWTRESLAAALREIRDRGWVRSRNPGNDGGVGNNLEDMLGIKENNLPVADAGNFEIKSHREGSTALITLFHREPLPHMGRHGPVEEFLLPKYGWPHQTLRGEWSFRSTTNAVAPTDRGFVVRVDREARQVQFHFDSAITDGRHATWLQTVRQRNGNLRDFTTVPNWPFGELEEICRDKLGQVFFVAADSRRHGGEEDLRYTRALLLSNFSFDRLLRAIEDGLVLVDFDARTGHNHGTKFRMREGEWPAFYGRQERVL